MIRNSKNVILYQGRYIRRLVHGVNKNTYIIAWAEGGSERAVYTGDLKSLISQIEDTVLFFGKWEFLI